MISAHLPPTEIMEDVMIPLRICTTRRIPAKRSNSTFRENVTDDSFSFFFCLFFRGHKILKRILTRMKRRKLYNLHQQGEKKTFYSLYEEVGRVFFSSSSSLLLQRPSKCKNIFPPSYHFQ